MGQSYLLSPNDDSDWRGWIDRAGLSDVYYMPEYALSWNCVLGGQARLFVYVDEGRTFIYPFRVRGLGQVSGLEHLSDWCDITSDYGYGGPVASPATAGRDAGFMAKAVAALDEVLSELHVVSEFCRFHPFLENHQIVTDVYNPALSNRIIWIDLKKPLMESFGKFRRNHRQDIVRAQEAGVEVVEFEPACSTRVLHRLYSGTMRNLEASIFYQFSLEYFTNCCQLLKNNAKIFLARYGETTICAGLFIHGRQFCHYHLMGWDRHYGYLTPNKLIIFRAIEWAQGKGLERLNLGGGYGGSDKDGLMYFKSGFSKHRLNFYIGKRIHREEIFRQACQAVGRPGEGENTYFPPYRAKALLEKK